MSNKELTEESLKVALKNSNPRHEELIKCWYRNYHSDVEDFKFKAKRKFETDVEYLNSRDKEIEESCKIRTMVEIVNGEIQLDDELFIKKNE